MYTIAEVAKALDVPARKVRLLIRSNKSSIEPVGCGGVYLLSDEDLKELENIMGKRKKPVDVEHEESAKDRESPLVANPVRVDNRAGIRRTEKSWRERQATLALMMREAGIK